MAGPSIEICTGSEEARPCYTLLCSPRLTKIIRVHPRLSVAKNLVLYATAPLHEIFVAGLVAGHRWFGSEEGFELLRSESGFIIGERLIFPFVAPAVAPAIPIFEIGVAAHAHADEHGFGEFGVTGGFDHAFAERFVRSESFGFCAAFPIGDVMLDATGAPIIRIDQRAVGEEGTTVAGELRELSGLLERDQVIGDDAD